jgi:hypothetical protein
MTSTFQTRDGRLVARLIMLAHRFGCDYTELSVTRNADVFDATITFVGASTQLRRLDAQIGKLLDYEKEIA